MKVKGIREKHVLREAAKDVLIPEVYDRQKHPFTTPPTRNKNDPMLAFYRDTFASQAAKDQPIYDMKKVATTLDQLLDCPDDQRIAVEGGLQRVASVIVDARAVFHGVSRGELLPTRSGLRAQRRITGLPSRANTIAGAMTDNALADPPTADTSPPGRISAEAGRRRTFAVISHPDAGKSTLTEALVLHASAITEAGAIHGKAGRRATVSDWMEMEKARGISITSTALQFPYSPTAGLRHQPARHPGPRRLLRRHLPGADGRRLRGDAHRRRERP